MHKTVLLIHTLVVMYMVHTTQTRVPILNLLVLLRMSCHCVEYMSTWRGWLKMQDVKMADHQNCRAWNCRTWNWRSYPYLIIIGYDFQLCSIIQPFGGPSN